MSIDPASFLFGFTIACALAVAWSFGEQKAIRLARRVARHGRNLDYVFFEDAERDATIKRPEPATADVREFDRQSSR